MRLSHPPLKVCIYPLLQMFCVVVLDIFWRLSHRSRMCVCVWIYRCVCAQSRVCKHPHIYRVSKKNICCLTLAPKWNLHSSQRYLLKIWMSFIEAMCESIHDGKYGFTLFWFATSHIFICRHVDGLMLISRSTVEVCIDPLQLIFAITKPFNTDCCYDSVLNDFREASHLVPDGVMAQY